MADSYDILQEQLAERYQKLHEDPCCEQDVVVLPSLSLDGVYASSIEGLEHYEERMLFTLNLLRYPRTRVIYLSSQPIDTVTVDYILSLIGGVPTAHMRSRLFMLSTQDGSPTALTEKILRRPRLLARIKDLLRPGVAHITCFAVSAAEQRLALALDVPLYGVHPDLLSLGSKSGSRALFKEAGISLLPGEENLRDENDIIDAAYRLCHSYPNTRRVVVKQDSGFSGQGNAVLDVSKIDVAALGQEQAKLRIRDQLPLMRFGDEGQSWAGFLEKFSAEQGIVEIFLEGDDKRIPSGQLRVSPLGTVDPVSTHDQIANDPEGQVYAGCRFPADSAHRDLVMRDSMTVGNLLREKGAIGRFAVDFICVKEADAWRHYAIEINLRLGGTSHPMMLLKMMTNGTYDSDSGLYLTRRGEAQYYVASDSLQSERYIGLLPEDLLDIGAMNDLHYQYWNDAGVIFHMLGGLSEFGKLGITAIGRSREEADLFFQKTQDVLANQCSK